MRKVQFIHRHLPCEFVPGTFGVDDARKIAAFVKPTQLRIGWVSTRSARHAVAGETSSYQDIPDTYDVAPARGGDGSVPAPAMSRLRPDMLSDVASGEPKDAVEEPPRPNVMGEVAGRASDAVDIDL